MTSRGPELPFARLRYARELLSEIHSPDLTVAKVARRVTFMRIKLTSVMVADQDRALAFYTDVLGFVKKHDIPVGGGFRWLTVVSPEGPDDVELALEPNANPVR